MYRVLEAIIVSLYHVNLYVLLLLLVKGENFILLKLNVTKIATARMSSLFWDTVYMSYSWHYKGNSQWTEQKDKPRLIFGDWQRFSPDVIIICRVALSFIATHCFGSWEFGRWTCSGIWRWNSKRPKCKQSLGKYTIILHTEVWGLALIPVLAVSRRI